MIISDRRHVICMLTFLIAVRILSHAIHIILCQFPQLVAIFTIPYKKQPKGGDFSKKSLSSEYF